MDEERLSQEHKSNLHHILLKVLTSHERNSTTQSDKESNQKMIYHLLKKERCLKDKGKERQFQVNKNDPTDKALLPGGKKDWKLAIQRYRKSLPNKVQTEHEDLKRHKNYQWCTDYTGEKKQDQSH
jgi:hypothetical protein